MDEFAKLVGEDQIDEELKSSDVKQASLKLAADAVDYAKSISPVGDGKDPHPGRYRDSIHVEDGEQVSVVFDDPEANLIEYGSINNPEYAIRARTEEFINNEARSR